MNEYDSQCIAGQLLKEGFVQAKTIKNSDIIIFNTCSVREHAKEKFYKNLILTSPLAKKNPDLIVGVCGCVAEQEGYKFFDEFSWVRLIVGPGNISGVGSYVKRVIKNDSRIIETGNFDRTKCVDIKRDKKGTALITIIRGCDNFCSYCVVPFVRGRETSRPQNEIIEEIKKAAKQGYKEVMLLGQNVCAYKNNEKLKNKNEKLKINDFAELLKEASKVKDIKKIQFMTSHPRDIDDTLIDAIVKLPKVAKEFHLPVQSGSDKILKEMNRGYTKKYYMDLVQIIRKKIPKARITTDIIVGFPGETDADFLETLDLVEKAAIDDAFTFKYSDRPGTKAKDKGSKVPEKTKEERLKVLQDKIAKK